MSVVIFTKQSANQFSMSNVNGEEIAVVSLKPKRGFALKPALGRKLTAAHSGHAKAFVSIERRESPKERA